MSLFLVFEAFASALSVILFVSLIELILDPYLKQPTKFTQFFLNIFSAPPKIFEISCIFILLNILKSVLDIIIKTNVLKIKYNVIRYLMDSILTVFFKAQWKLFSDLNQGRLLNTFNREMNIVGDTFGSIASQFAQSFQIISFLSIAFFINFYISSIALSIIFVLSLPFLYFGKISYFFGNENTRTSNKIYSILHETFLNSKIIICFANQFKTLNKFLNVFDHHVSATIKSQVLQSSVSAFIQPICLVAGLAAIGIGHYKGIPLAESGAILWSFFRATPAIGNLFQGNISISNFVPSYEQVSQLKTQAENLAEKSGSIKFKKIKKLISLKNVSFAFPGRKQILNNINLEIVKNKITILKGESGSGKSTIVDLICGLRKPVSGEIFYDKTNSSKLNLNSFRKKIGIVSQEPFLFNFSIKENLLWAKPDATVKQIWQACRLANAEKFIKKMPKQLDSSVGERGTNLSGGQRQRIALARALLRKPDLLILDEATGSLDKKTESKIKNELFKIKKKTTIFIISHSNFDLLKADKVFVLKNKKIYIQK